MGHLRTAYLRLRCRSHCYFFVFTAAPLELLEADVVALGCGANVTFAAAAFISATERSSAAFSFALSFTTAFPLEKSIVLPSWIATPGLAEGARGMLPRREIDHSPTAINIAATMSNIIRAFTGRD